MAKLPTFVIIGAGKAGTTALYHYLAQHPKVFMCPVKEPGYFAWDESFNTLDFKAIGDTRKRFPVRTRAPYEKLFKKSGDAPAIGDVDPYYMHQEHSAARCQMMLPDARIIAILRNPVERAIAAWTMHVRDGYETRSLAQAIKDEDAGINSEYPLGYVHYFNYGCYYDKLKPWFDRYPAKQIRIYLFDDFKCDAVGLFQEMLEFIGVDRTFVPDTSLQYNKSGVPKNPLIHFLTKKRPWTTAIKNKLPQSIATPITKNMINMNQSNLKKPVVDDEIRRQLAERYLPNIEKTEILTGLDLSAWRMK